METSFGRIARGCLCAQSRHEKSGAFCYRVKARRDEALEAVRAVNFGALPLQFRGRMLQ